MIEVLLLLTGVLLAIIIAASIKYFINVRRAQKEYEKAREAVEDIVISFNRELKREAEKLELVAFRVEGTAAKASASLKRVESIEQKIGPIESKVNAINENENVSQFMEELNKLRKSIFQINEKVSELGIALTVELLLNYWRHLNQTVRLESANDLILDNLVNLKQNLGNYRLIESHRLMDGFL